MEKKRKRIKWEHKLANECDVKYMGDNGWQICASKINEGGTTLYWFKRNK